jgi:hypothetical protein
MSETAPLVGFVATVVGLALSTLLFAFAGHNPRFAWGVHPVEYPLIACGALSIGTWGYVLAREGRGVVGDA